MRVPRCGTHNGIKYGPKRTLVRWCIICNNPFHPNGSRDKVCSDICRDKKTYNYNFKKNPIHNSSAIYQPPKTEEERKRRNNNWKKWYANTTLDYKIRYNKRKNKKNNQEPEVSTDAELDALYAELGMSRR